jgi:hypothetical protein
MEGLLLGSRELLCLSSRISRTLVSCSSLSELYLLGESVSCQMQGESVGWWSNFILSPRKTGGFFRGARYVTSTLRHSGADKSSRPLTGFDTNPANRTTGHPSPVARTQIGKGRHSLCLRSSAVPRNACAWFLKKGRRVRSRRKNAGPSKARTLKKTKIMARL